MELNEMPLTEIAKNYLKHGKIKCIPSNGDSCLILGIDKRHHTDVCGTRFQCTRFLSQFLHGYRAVLAPESLF